MRSFSVFPPTPRFSLPLHKPPSCSCRSTTTATAIDVRRQNKIVVIMGPTGCGKTKLSVDLASRFFPSSEIINSDKIQVYSGLDITTNKIPLAERNNVIHRLLGDFHPTDSLPEFTPSDYRSYASLAISQILSHGGLPFIAGGSNSFIYALLADKFNPDVDVFSDSNSEDVFCRDLRYDSCFVWVHVSPPVLNEYLVKRVDDMLVLGMLEELAAYFSNPESETTSQSGLKKAIGVPEFERYFKRFPNKGNSWGVGDDVAKRRAYEEAVRAIKENTCQLATRQLGKIVRLRDAAGWNINVVDATASLRAKMDGGRTAEIWETQVVEPSVKIVRRFLMD